mmetsp:Transcript_8453/g.17184  ORF Transcript_8453/g.17184 Transcript_8453/m.17184 type:complete len:201 (-) Transcript_8453:18-620(-)
MEPRLGEGGHLQDGAADADEHCPTEEEREEAGVARLHGAPHEPESRRDGDGRSASEGSVPNDVDQHDYQRGEGLRDVPQHDAGGADENDARLVRVHDGRDLVGHEDHAVDDGGRAKGEDVDLQVAPSGPSLPPKKPADVPRDPDLHPLLLLSCHAQRHCLRGVSFRDCAFSSPPRPQRREPKSEARGPSLTLRRAPLTPV